MDTLSSSVWVETLEKEKRAHKKWLARQGRKADESEDEEDPDAVANYESMLAKMVSKAVPIPRSVHFVNRRGGENASKFLYPCTSYLTLPHSASHEYLDTSF